MLKTGTLDRRISIERRTDTLDDHGQPIPVWNRIGKVRWARYAPVNGNERFISDQFIARQQIEWLVRWTEDLADTNPLDRVVYPVTSTPANSDIYDILAVNEVGYRDALQIITARRSEVP